MDENNGGTSTVMPVQPIGYGGGYGYGVPMMPMYGNYGGGFGGFGNGFGFGGDGAWLLLFLVLAMGGGMGWGGLGGFGGMWGMDGAFPWLLASNANNQNSTNAGFDSLQLSNQISGLRSDVTGGFSDTALGIAGVNQNICQSTGQIQNSLCQGFAGTTAAVTNAQNAVTQQLYNNEIASLNRSFAEQTANMQGQNAIQTQIAASQANFNQCCCDARAQENANAADLKYTIATENCADRAALSDGVRDLLTAQTANTQRILDKLCDQELAAAQRENAELRTRLNMADLAASQAAQTAALVADNTAQTQYIVNRVAPYPIPAFPVGNPYGYNSYYGNSYGCGCGNNGFGFAG